MNNHIQARITEDIVQLLSKQKRVIVGIDGMSTSGKTTLAHALAHRLYARVIHMDDFFLQDHQRTEERLKQIGGNIDDERFQIEVIDAIKDNRDIHYHKYDCQTKTMEKVVIKNDYHLLIIEGAYALKPSFREIYDIKYLMLIDSDIQVKRIHSRNPDLYNRFIHEWIPMENKYIESTNIKELVDQIIMN